MPLFDIEEDCLVQAKQINFALEKELQKIVEENLEIIFNCKFIATEFSTGIQHSGRIDTLALSEDNNPIIIEYKKVESSDLINQSLFYLHWIEDHRGDYEIAVKKALQEDIEIDWSNVRVICIAPNYKKYDLHVVQVMGANIELWKYRLFNNKSLYLEEIYHNKPKITNSQNKNPIMIKAGKKAAYTRATATYTIDEHISNGDNLHDLILLVREYILSIDSSIEEVPKKYYIAYKVSQNLVCMRIESKHIKLWLKLKSLDIGKNPPKCYRDVTSIGHFGTGDSEFIISTRNEFEKLKPYIRLAYDKLG